MYNNKENGIMICRKNVEAAIMFLVFLNFGASQQLLAHTCPDNAVSTGVGLVLTAFHADGVTPIGATCAGNCEKIVLRASLSYIPFDSQNNPVAAFSDGNIVISKKTGSFSEEVATEREVATNLA